MTQPGISRAQDGGRYTQTRVFVGAILLLAALLKAYQLATEPTAEISLMTSRWFLVFSVQFELLLGLCLIAGLFVRTAWLTTLGSFALFSCISLHKALSGEVSCGCFGSVQVNPWYTLGLDLAVVGALVRYRPALWGKEVGTDTRPASHYGVVFGVWLIVAVSAGWGMSRFEANTVSDDGMFLGDGEIVVLEPETWTGKRFPLFAHIDQGGQLARGVWLVVLYHHDCPQCQEVLPSYELLAAETDEDQRSVALVEVPPFGPREGRDSSISPVHRVRLQDTKDWFVQTPTEIQLTDGTVTAVRGAKELEEASKKEVEKDTARSEGRQATGAVVRHVNYEQGADP